MLQKFLEFVVRNFGSFLILLLLVRFYMQTARLPFNQGVGQFVMAFTNFMVCPARKIVRSIMGLDAACLVLAWLIAVIMHWVLLAITPWPFNFLALSSIVSLVLLGLMEIVRLSLYLLFAVVMGLAVFSWVNPKSPFMPMLARLAEPFLRPLRRVIPVIGGIDITPLVLVFIIQLILSVMVNRLEAEILQLMAINGM